ncbi:inorganic pyrophosphatase, putative [Trypanosoma brucei gambiense DAL972]|uniref:inorganic diphosphatase n=2 Tax=Trypanosoma brucei TaxID=5691 RepID=C9ZKI7_TRYB9|nr:inorganic pyrophosphatase, putative [Trypanosoma brucei gambiense DAL972]RHW73766.1 inorganic pyrophosphatase [Trypanosoma brucei equiperdum]CBH09953.1 inorganic pyrophosphatase, putative [Trypanosoma brucei gambiense DAL972]|eukprot:XP_011772244.1 inorganic pyrophosphatase, putative [Trypanosoma brucei gambiense DAL972]
MRPTSIMFKGMTGAGIILPAWALQEVGAAGTRAWRMYFTSSEAGSVARRSAWHDLPLHPSPDASVITFVCEIPRRTRAKLELVKEEPHNPIAQDTLKKEGNALRFFKYGDVPFNYGFAPQTWEDPSVVDQLTTCGGDGDPIDIVELSSNPFAVGSVRAVRVLGLLGLIDEGETDWKVITEAIGPDATGTYGSLNNVPQELKATIVKWFREYKTADGKKPNEFVFGGELRNADDALRVIEGGSRQYTGLIAGTVRNPGYWLH